MANTNANLWHLIQGRIASAGCFIRSTDGADLFSYADLDRRSGQWAAVFRDLGLQPGDRVIAQVEKSAECLFMYFACLRAGLIYVPLNPAYQQHEVLYFMNDADPALVICDPAKTPLFESAARCPVLTLDQHGGGSSSALLTEANDDPDIEIRTADDVAVILYTSGTTGKPKGAMISHGNLASNGLALLAAWGWQPDDILLHALPIFHIHGLFVATHLAVLNGSPILFLPKFDPDTIIRLLPSATVYMGVPTNYTRLLDRPALTRAVAANMRLFTSGSAPLLVNTFEEFRSRTGHTILERYGMTETGMNTSNPLDGARKAGTVGPPLAGVSIRILDDQGQAVAVGVPGNLQVRGSNVFKGYWRLPEKTAEEFAADQWFRTGDVASLDQDGYVSIVGRNKDMIISGGLNVYPKEIESVIDALPGVLESAVIGLPHPDFGEAVTAVVVREPGATLAEEDVIRHLKTTLANFKVAKRVHFVGELPRNTMGKVQKNLLRDQFVNAATD